MKFKNKNLLVIADAYPQDDLHRCEFVKSYTDLIKDKFNTVTVIVPSKLIVPKLILQLINKLTKKNPFVELHESLLDNYSYDNVEIKRVCSFPLFHPLLTNLKKALTFKSIELTIKHDNISYDLIHAHFGEYSGYYAWKISKNNNKPYLITLHESNLVEKKYLNSDYLRGADALTTVSSKNMSVLANFHHNKKTYFIPNFVNTSKFKPIDINQARKHLNLSKDSFILLNIANYRNYQKKQSDIIKISKKIKQLDPSIPLKTILIGTGKDRAMFKQMIANLNLINVVKLIAQKSPEELVYYYNSSNAFILSSAYESFGIVQIEALACGVPVFAFNNGSSEFLLDSNVGKVYKERDLDLVAQDLVKLYNATSTFDKNNIRKYAIKKFDQSISKQQLLDLYGKLLT